jgi:hypothetical protein
MNLILRVCLYLPHVNANLDVISGRVEIRFELRTTCSDIMINYRVEIRFELRTTCSDIMINYYHLSQKPKLLRKLVANLRDA